MSKTIHQIWTGPRKAPTRAMASWPRLNPKWEYRAWDNDDLRDRKWVLRPQIDEMEKHGHWCGVADCMRLEILHEHGGLYIDADATCIRPLTDELPDEFLLYENEAAQAGMVCNGIIAANAGNEFILNCINEVARLTPEDLAFYAPWQCTGPVMITRMAGLFAHPPILPSRYFLPMHHSGTRAPGNLRPFASHAWFTTFNSD